MSLKPGRPSSESLFANVDWTRTKAYAAGLNGIYVNLQGRERLGIVRAGDVAKVKREIAEKLSGFVDPVSGVPAPLIDVNRKNWSGDHCVDPALVPGVLFTSFRKNGSLQSIAAVPGLIRRSFIRST